MSMMALAVVLFIVSFVFIYKYRNTFRLGSVLHSLRKIAGKDALASTDENVKHVEEFEESVESSNSSTGNAGKWLLFTAVYIFAGTMALASDPERWGTVNNVLQVIFSWQTIFSFLAFASLAGILTGGAIMFLFFSWNGGLEDMTDEYALLVKKTAGTVAMWSSILFPLFLMISYAYLPASALSPDVFYYMVIVLIISLIAGGFIYSMVKNSDTGSATAPFVLIIVLITFNIIKDQLAFGNAIHNVTVEIVKIAEGNEKEAKNKSLQTTGIDAEAIFTQKCSACHKFDQKVVGPPYKESVPKYNGDVQKLADYIFNPQKIDPAYPQMPNQGLKKKEATAMAKWLIDQVGKK
jgi:cytochrome c